LTDVAVYSTQPILIAGLETILATTGDLQVAASADTVPELLNDIAVRRPAVVLVEASPEIGLDLIHHLRSRSDAPIVLWVDTVAVEFISQVLGLGVRGILRKTMPPAAIVDCLRKVSAGELWVEKALCDRLLSTRRIALTPRERQLLALLAQGLKNKEIAWSLRITEGTVKVYLSRLFQKVGVNDRFDLALFALRNFAGSPENFATQKEPALPGRETLSVPEFLPPFVSFARHVQ